MKKITNGEQKKEPKVLLISMFLNPTLKVHNNQKLLLKKH